MTFSTATGSAFADSQFPSVTQSRGASRRAGPRSIARRRARSAMVPFSPPRDGGSPIDQLVFESAVSETRTWSKRSGGGHVMVTYPFVLSPG
jgi:hypothetical protein